VLGDHAVEASEVLSRQKTEDRRRESEVRRQTPNPELALLVVMDHCWPIHGGRPLRRRPEKRVDLRPARAARDRTPS